MLEVLEIWLNQICKKKKRLAEEIRKFPCLYHKGNEGYKVKDRKKKRMA